jgi:hypothetical protein
MPIVDQQTMDDARVAQANRVPTEIVEQILSWLAPGGLCISNDQSSDLVTIRTILTMSFIVKQLMLRHLYSRPLHI